MLYKVGDNFGLGFNQVRQRFPNVSFPLGEDIVGFEGVEPYERAEIPQYDPITQGVREIAPTSGVQQWQIYQLPPEQVEANQKALVPFAVTMRQARIILALQPSPEEAFPHLLAYITAQFESLPEPDKTVAQITWEYSTEVQRTNPLIAQVSAMAGLTEAQIDQLFIQAATL